eukprot:CAMPEP_0202455942 /NCGR_PEP_ID=MMETSP1360-20130828/13337_1 /ASSEMBLY_ACC=CAM_ASM_000848 /TAXON_ID=515479 /ORGANISM="Licmophora paradoxa, Strain CCMP2313" /LENGTH=181 /DNA_ID=CAMNT_0049075637 /DNA_START=61 /DNA_END=606 /DNA_ORIENTATION=+
MMAGRRNVSTNAASGANGNGTNGSAGPKRSQRRGGRASSNFNPRLIFSQIVAIQCFHYLMLGVVFQINHAMFGTSITIDRIFTDKYLNVWTWQGWIDNSAIIFSYLFGALLLAIVVEKSKKCLDFSVTLFMIHLISCVWYAGVPKNFDWYMVHIGGTIVMTLLGEYLCSLKELSDIPLLEF